MAKNRIIPIMTQYKNYEVYNWYIKGKDDTYKNILKTPQKKRMKNIPKRRENVTYVDLKIDTVFCDGNMKTSVDGHPRVYMSFSSKRSKVGKMIEDRNQVRCSYCGRQFIRK